MQRVFVDVRCGDKKVDRSCHPRGPKRAHQKVLGRRFRKHLSEDQQVYVMTVKVTLCLTILVRLLSLLLSPKARAVKMVLPSWKTRIASVENMHSILSYLRFLYIAKNGVETAYRLWSLVVMFLKPLLAKGETSSGVDSAKQVSCPEK